MASPFGESKPAKKKAIQETLHGLDITIEYRKGERKADSGKPYSYGWPMHADYGFVNGTVSPEEGEELDCYVGPNRESTKVFIAPLLRDGEAESYNAPNRADPGEFDEHKVLLGFETIEDARAHMYEQYGMWRTGQLIESTYEELIDLASLNQVKNNKEKLLVAQEGIGGTTAPDLKIAEHKEPPLVVIL